jgi:serine/threonine-protein kinase
VDGGGPFVALSIRGGEAIAYLCDGRTLEAWLWGELDGDEIILRGDPKASRQALLAGRLGGGKVSGAVLLGQRRWTFSAPRAVRPSGLYRATKQVRGANVVAGWVVLPDGRQVGMTTTDGGEPLPAPRLDPADGSARIDGTEITALPGDPANAPTWVVR